MFNFGRGERHISSEPQRERELNTADEKMTQADFETEFKQIIGKEVLAFYQIWPNLAEAETELALGDITYNVWRQLTGAFEGDEVTRVPNHEITEEVVINATQARLRLMHPHLVGDDVGLSS